jgi:uncharacterized OB-fold protein
MKSSEIPNDVPAPDEVTEAYWESTRSHTLTLQRCKACGSYQHPPRAVCTSCSETSKLEQVAVSGQGTIDTFTVVHRSPRLELDVPYAIARVRLGEGPVVLTRLEPSEGWTIGDQVEVSWVDLQDGRALPIFIPADA